MPLALSLMLMCAAPTAAAAAATAAPAPGSAPSTPATAPSSTPLPRSDAAAMPCAPEPAPVSPRARELSLILARNGTLAQLIPFIALKETEELVAARTDLTPDQRDALRDSGARVGRAGLARVIAAEAAAWAEALTEDDLAALAAFESGPLAERRRRVQPQVVATTMLSLGVVDYKGEVLADFCAGAGAGSTGCTAR